MSKHIWSLAIVLLLGLTLTGCHDDDDTPMPGNKFSVYDVIKNSSDHQTLLAAINAADLEGALNDQKADLTVFAPTDAAFEAIPEETLANLLANPGGLLTNILLYHVVNGRYLSSDLSDGMLLTTLDGGAQLKISIVDENVYVNDPSTIDNSDTNIKIYVNNALITIANLKANNGVVHVIDAVLIPESTNDE
ncbi:MAG: fasciclin domain-containing protein [Bacteroidales bacterium]